MNFIGTVLGILQEMDADEVVHSPIYTQKYIITVDGLNRTTRRILIKSVENDPSRYETLDIIVGSGVSNSGSKTGLSHYTLDSSVHGKNCYSWYQMRVPCESFCNVDYISTTNFVDTHQCVVDITSDEDVFQKSTIVDINIEEIQSLVLEMTQLDQYLAASENLLVICNGYHKLDFNEIFEALNG